MSTFLHYALGFPTFIFGALLLCMLLYWLIALLGLVETDSLDQWLLFDGSDHAHGVEHSVSALAGLLLKVGLGGIPATVILTVLLLGLLYKPDGSSYTPVTVPDAQDTVEMFRSYTHALPE